MNELGLVGGIAAMAAFWGLVLFVLPYFVVVYISRAFPLTGQWRKKFSDGRQRRN